jgi:hypothetical protein
MGAEAGGEIIVHAALHNQQIDSASTALIIG